MLLDENHQTRFVFRTANRNWRKVGLYRLVPTSAKNLAAACALMRSCEKKALRKLHSAARLCKARKKRGGFDSLHPLHDYQRFTSEWG